MHGLANTDHLTSQRVLVVEDEPRLRQVLVRYLQQRGHQVAEAASAAQARTCLERQPVDIVLLDINLGEETGWDVLRWLQARAPTRRPTIVVISAVPPATRRLEEFTPDAVLTKPFPIDAVARLVESAGEPLEESLPDA